MKVMILGAGIIGTTTAYYLNKAGHEVTVIDRENGVADETSYGNAGQLSFGYTTPWAAPNTPFKALKWLGKEHSPLIIKIDGSWYQAKWMTQMTANCTESAYTRNQSRMMRISEYSRAMLHQFETEEKLYFEQRHKGTLHLFRDQKLFDDHQKHMHVLDSFDVPYQQLDATGVLQYEPALAHIQDEIAGAFHLPNDSTGDCRIFTQNLAKLCQDRGVKFLFGHNITSVKTIGNDIFSIVTDKGEYKADAYVCALGCFSRYLINSLGIDLPVYPVKGYSLTIPISNADNAPQSTVLDETYKVALTRFDNRIRVGGMAELSGYHIKLPEVHRETLAMVTNKLFPNSCDIGKAEYWSGLRPMTPDSTPVIGKTRFNNLFTNTGHGTLGWTMSLGSGRIIADLITVGHAEVQTDDLGISRYT